MKPLVIFCLMWSSFFQAPKIVQFHISGTVRNTEHAKFAYLSTLSQQIPISSDKLFMVVPIVDGKFEFKATFDLEDKNFQQACVFVDDRGNITKEELASKFKQLIWVTGRDKNLQRIVLENLTLDIEGRDEMKFSKVSANGLLTKQLHEWFSATRLGSRKLAEFVKKYPDSPVSLNAIGSVMMSFTEEERLENYGGSPLELYATLSNKIKLSKEGMALKKKIDEKYRP